MRRRAASAQSKPTSSTCDRGAAPGSATVAFHTIWTQAGGGKAGRGWGEGSKRWPRINSCLGPHDHVVPEKESELDEALTDYMRKLAGAIGAERARLDMLLKAVPAVGVKVRAMPADTAPRRATHGMGWDHHAVAASAAGNGPILPSWLTRRADRVCVGLTRGSR
jgi:hypothetical protein